MAVLTASTLLSVHQSCRDKATLVYRIVSDFRRLFKTSVISNFAMYHFIYECVLITSCASPTIFVGSKSDFKQCYKHLFTRRHGRLQPIVEQFKLIANISKMYRDRNDKRRDSRLRTFTDCGINFCKLPSYRLKYQFLALKNEAIVNIDFANLMAKEGCRYLLWFAEPNANKRAVFNGQQIAVGKSHHHHQGFDEFQVEMPSLDRGMWRMTVFKYSNWPSGAEKLSGSSNQFLKMLRFIVSKSGQTPVALFEQSKQNSRLWRSGLTAISLFLDQRMEQMNEVDVFRSAILFKLYNPNYFLSSISQFKFCLSIAWHSCLFWQSQRQNSEIIGNTTIEFG